MYLLMLGVDMLPSSCVGVEANEEEEDDEDIYLTQNIPNDNNIGVLTVVDRQAGRNEEAEMYYKRSVELRPAVSDSVSHLFIHLYISVLDRTY